jgi:hypothetical protein
LLRWVFNHLREVVGVFVRFHCAASPTLTSN